MNSNDLYQNENDYKNDAQSIYQNDREEKKVEKGRSLYQNDFEIEITDAYQSDDKIEKKVMKKNLTVDDEDVYHTPESEDVNAALRRAKVKISALKRIGSQQRNKLKQEAKRQIPVEEHIYDGVYDEDDSDTKKGISRHSLMRLRSSMEDKPSDKKRCYSIKCLLLVGCLLFCMAAGGGVATYFLMQDDKTTTIATGIQKSSMEMHD